MRQALRIEVVAPGLESPAAGADLMAPIAIRVDAEDCASSGAMEGSGVQANAVADAKAAMSLRSNGASATVVEANR